VNCNMNCNLTAIMIGCALLAVSNFSASALAAPETALTSTSEDERTCKAVTGLNLEDATVRQNVDALTFDFDRDPATLARSRRIYDASSFDLRAFKAHGGKMLMWHGWADGSIMATSSIGYYEGVRKFMGGRDKTEDFFRLFLVPGVHHGGGGPGLKEFDALSALEDWVEKGHAPDKLIAGRVTNGVVERSRPVYPYPMMARYSGKGDPMQADSFVPFDPSPR
jgi:feruloyl esterase